MRGELFGDSEGGCNSEWVVMVRGEVFGDSEGVVIVRRL